MNQFPESLIANYKAIATIESHRVALLGWSVCVLTFGLIVSLIAVTALAVVAYRESR